MSPTVAQRREALEERSETIPLAVDLDGTLIKTDMLWESLIALLKTNVFAIFLLPFWLIKGRAYLKHEIARRITLDVATLPFNKEFLAFLQEEHKRGRVLILTTASDRTIAEKIADHLGIFSEVMASNGKHNLKAAEKSRALQEKFGNKCFDYAGNEKADLEVWAHTNAAILVNAPDGALKKAQRLTPVIKVYNNNQDNTLTAIVRVIRVKHWIKNALVFVPLLASHQLIDFALLLNGTYAFIGFSLVASSVYVFNDLADLNNDRHHHQKRHRPFASGELSLLSGLIMMHVLLIGAILVSLLLPVGFLFTLLGYYVLNVAYSLYLKKALLVDVLSLATFYAARVFAGGAATGIMPSEWLLAFCVFIFLSLAFAKRVSELQFLRENNKEKAHGRGYLPNDLESLASLGATSGYIGVLVFALYINSPEVNQLYSYPRALWIACPFLLYWISRLWLLVHRHEVPEDPIVFVINDKVSYLVGFAVSVTLVLAS